MGSCHLNRPNVSNQSTPPSHFRTAQSNLQCVEHVPLLKNKTVDCSKVFQTLKTLLLDGNFELALLHVQRVSEKLGKERSETEEKLSESGTASSETEKEVSESDSERGSLETEELTPQSIVDTQELKEELAEAMDTQESSLNTQDFSVTSSDAGTQDSSVVSRDSTTPSSSPKRVKFSENSKPEPSDSKHETIISSLCKHKDNVRGLSEFYMKYIEEGAERQEERDMIRMTSPLFKHYNSKASTDQDRYLDTLGGLLTKVMYNYLLIISSIK